MYFCVPKCRLPWHKVKPIKAKKDVKEFYAQKHKWRRGKEEEIKLKNSKVFEQKGDFLNFKANIDPRAVLS